MVVHPASGGAASPVDGDASGRLQGSLALGLPGKIHFGAAVPWLTCSPAYASTGTSPPRLQGLATDLRGYAVVGRDSHPLGNRPKFVKSPHDSLLSDRHCLVATTKGKPPDIFVLSSFVLS